LKQAGLPVKPENIVRGGFTVEEGETAMERILGRAELPDAVFCVNDPTALGAFKALRRRGLRVPDTIGLAGFSDILEAEIMEVPLTTVAQDAGLLGQQAARLLLARMSAASQEPPMHQVVKTHLVVRRSTQRNG
jgi:DNA-binding LacI/PurR family transcriptional regulator